MSDLLGDVVFSVSDLTKLLKTTLEGSFYGLTLEGEISNFRPASSGHWYFQLNDANQKSWRIPFVPKDGDIVLVTGSISLYEKRGTYQILCETMVRSGKGDILALLEERKRAFAEAGFFDASLKRTLPRYPKRVGVVTSPTGAALQDILQVLGRRNNGIDIVILPAPVQGDGAAQVIADQLHAANRLELADVLIVGRGGGSLEDLLPFSEQCVIEAIVASHIPVISAVGHEIDWALSDYAADLRAPTPSAAAELVSESRSEQLERIASLKQAMAGAVSQKIALTR
ncbi:MAG: exodeoxyribonuclease VII large subunit, partial [Spirochaetae bacterium HGW-Spirochaetae-8]